MTGDQAGAAGATAESGRGRRRLLALARIGLGLAILGFVLSTLSFEDVLVFRAPDGSQLELAGEIEGSWRGDEIVFRPAGPAPEASASWPADTREALVVGRELAVSRAPEGSSGFDWRIGLRRTFSELDPGGLLPALGLLSLGMLVVVTRWWRLLAVAGCRTSWFDAFRLTFLGMFFNLAVPGLTGGDLVKGVIAARENPGKRADALVSVAVDRLLGLFALAALGAGVILVAGDRFAELRAPLFVLIGLALLAVVLYATPFLRKGLGLSALLNRLPFSDKLRSLDRAALLYMRQPLDLALALVLSLLNHVVIVLAVYFLGLAFRAEGVGLSDFLVLVPIANIVSALPVAPGGWGVGEAAFKFLFEMVGASGAVGVAISVTFRLFQLGFGLIGGAFLLLPGSKAHVRDMAREVAMETETP